MPIELAGARGVEPGTQLGAQMGAQRSGSEQPSIEIQRLVRAPAPRTARGLAVGVVWSTERRSAQVRAARRRRRTSCPRAWSSGRATTRLGPPGRVKPERSPQPPRPAARSGSWPHRASSSLRACRGSSARDGPRSDASRSSTAPARVRQADRETARSVPAAHGRTGAASQTAPRSRPEAGWCRARRRSRSASRPGIACRSRARRAPAGRSPRSASPAAPTRHGPRTGSRRPVPAAPSPPGSLRGRARRTRGERRACSPPGRRYSPRTCRPRRRAPLSRASPVDRGPHSAASASRGRR